MSLDLSHFSKILEAVYGTALNDNRWPDLFEILRHATGLEHFALHGYDKKLQSHALAARRRGVYESFIPSFENYYWTINPWLPGLAKAPVGRAVYAEELCPEERVRKSEFNNDWARHLDDIGTGGAIVLFRDESRLLTLGGNIPFSQRDSLQSNWTAILNLLSPHLRHAFELRRQLAGKQLKDSAYLHALDAIPNAVLLLNARGCVSYTNTAGQRLLKAGTGIYQDAKGTLRTYEPKAAKMLGKAVYDIGEKRAPEQPKQFVLQKKDSTSHSIATLTPFAPDPSNIDKFAAFAADDVPVAIMTVTDPEQRKKPPRELFATLFRLTPAETNLALALSLDQSLYNYADEKQLSRHTVRNQLKAIFQKTGTNSQARLVSELNRLF